MAARIFNKDANRYGTACTEENELLNVNSIKMTEAPFGRSDSEDDIIEDYDDAISFKAPCLHNRTPLERGLLLLVFLALVVIIALAVGLTRPKIEPVEEYCKSAPCIRAASAILSAMDRSVSPCENFFQYACGGWIRQNPIPPGYHKWDRFQELSGKNLYVLKNLIETQTPQGAAQTKAQTFYNSCMADSHRPKSRTLAAFRALIDSLGGWSLDRKPFNDTWIFQLTLEKIHRLGAWPIFKLVVDVDERDPTERHILKIDIGETVLPAEMFPEPRQSTTPQPTTTTAATSTPGSSTPGNHTNNSTDKATTTTTTSTTTPIPTEPPRPTKNMSEVREVFLDDTRGLLVTFGASENEAQKMAEDMIELEEAIASASPRTEHLHSRMELYSIRSIYDLERNYSMLSWVQYLNILGFSVTEDDHVVVLHQEYMVAITRIVKDYLSLPRTRKILRDYLMLSLIRYLRQYFAPGTFQTEEREEDELIEHWKRCTFYANKAMSFATGAIYVKGSSHEGTIDKVENLITYVKGAFKDYLLGKFWMDSQTRKRATEKIDHIIDKISYPSFILNTTFLDSFYKQLSVIKNAWFQNLMNWRKFELGKMNHLLTEKPDRKKSWLRPPVTVNAFYSANQNDIIFPIAMFHLPFYIPDGPSSVNFGAMGSVIGHEITHAFDPQGRQYDRVGKLKDWWDPATLEKFYVTTECMKTQYGRFRILDYRLNGEFTLDENIADNGGLRAAIYAYKMWRDQHGEEPPLPGLNLSHYQIFFTSYAQMYCSKWTELGLLNHLLKDPHSPGIARVNGVLTNSKTFSWAFQCSNIAAMNSRIKCEVW